MCGAPHTPVAHSFHTIVASRELVSAGRLHWPLLMGARAFSGKPGDVIDVVGTPVANPSGTEGATVPSTVVSDALGRIGKPGKTTKDKILNKAVHHDFPRAKAVRKRFKTSIKKLNPVCKIVRRSRVDAALMQLSLSPKRAAREVRRLIYKAKFNAANNHGMDPDNLLVDEIVIGRSTYLRRLDIKGRGKQGMRRRPYCFAAVFVREIQPSDEFVHLHLKRRRPRWKQGPMRWV